VCISSYEIRGEGTFFYMIVFFFLYIYLFINPWVGGGGWWLWCEVWAVID